MNDKDKQPMDAAAMGRHGASRYLGVSLTSLDKLFASGALTKLKFGRKTLVRKADLDRLLDSLAADDKESSDA